MPWMVKWAGPFPPYVESAAGAHFRCVDGHDYVDFCLGDTGAMAGHGPRSDDGRGRTADAARHHPHAPDRGRRLGRRGADPAVRRRVVAVRPVGQRRQPLGPAPRPADHRPEQGRRPRPLLSRLGRRGDRDARPRRVGRARPRLGRAPGRRRRDDPRRRVQRHRRPRGRPRRRRRRRRPHRAGPDQRRDRAAGARLPRRRARDHAADRNAARHRRDAHDLRGTGRRHRPCGVSSPTSSSSARPSAAGSRRRRTASARRSRRASPARSRSRIPTSAGSAGRWPATRCRWPRRGPRSARS